MAKIVKIPYQPRDWQLNEHMNLARFTVMVVHRRAGKTHFAVNELLKRALDSSKKRPQVAYIAPTYRQAKQVSWEIFKEVVAPIPNVKVNESELRIDLPNGGRILVLGAENPDSLRGLYLDYAVLDEVADMPETLWNTVIRPALSDREGGALFIGTPKGQNFFYDLYVRGKTQKGWRSIKLSYHDTKALKDSEIHDLKLELSPEDFEQEMECSFTAAIRGAYFGRNLTKAEDEGRMCHVPYDPELPVITGWDIGFDGTVVWYAQMVLNRVNIIDCDVFKKGEDVPDVVKVVKNKPYVYDRQILPHDAVKRSNTNKKLTVKGTIEGFGLKCTVAPRDDIMTGINAARRLIDKASFDAEKCREGLVGLSLYCPDSSHELTHIPDALRTLAVGLTRSDAQGQARHIGVYGRYDALAPSYNHVQNNWDVFN